MQRKKHRNGEIYELTLPNSKLGAQELWTLPGMLPSTDGIVDRALVTGSVVSALHLPAYYFISYYLTKA